MSKLTGKQAQFISSYLGEARFNASLAAKLAGYRARSKHSFEQIGHENLQKPQIRSVIDEHFKLSRMSADECLIELSRLARGSGKDQIRALALLSQYHGLLNGGAKEQDFEARVREEVDKRIDQICREVEGEIRQEHEDKDKQWRAMVKRYSDSPITVEALHFLRDVMAGIRSIDTEPRHTGVEIIRRERRQEAFVD